MNRLPAPFLEVYLLVGGYTFAYIGALGVIIGYGSWSMTNLGVAAIIAVAVKVLIDQRDNTGLKPEFRA